MVSSPNQNLGFDSLFPRMEKSELFWTYLLAGVVGLFLFFTLSYMANASGFPNQFLFDQSLVLPNNTTSTIQLGQGISGSASGLKIKIDTSTTDGNAHLAITLASSTTSDYSTISFLQSMWCTNNQDLLSGGSAALNSNGASACKIFDDGTIHLWFSDDGITTTTYNFDPQYYYQFIRPSNAVNGTSTWLGTDTAIYGGTSIDTTDHLFTPYMDWGGATCTSCGVNHIEFVVPSDDASGQPFANWKLDLIRTATTSLTREIRVYYNQDSSSTFAHTDAVNQTGNLQGQFHAWIPVSFNLLTNSTTTGGTTPPLASWYAYATLSEGGVEVVRTEVINFVVVNDLDIPPFPDDDGGILDPPNVDCVIDLSGDGVLCIVKKSFAFAINLIFLPHRISSTYLNGAWQELVQVFPFNLVFGIHADILGSASNVSSTVPTVAWNPPDPFPSSTSFVLLSSSTLSNVLGTENKTLFFTLQAALIWCLTGFACYKIIAHKS